MAKALPNTFAKLKFETVAATASAISSSPESKTAGKFWVIQFITIGLDAVITAATTVSISFGGTIVWQVELPVNMVQPLHIDFGAGLYTGVKNEDFTINVDDPGTNKVSLSYGYF